MLRTLIIDDEAHMRDIFITAYDQYAIQAIKFSAVDYLLKPVNPEELEKAVGKADPIIQTQFSLQMKALEENLKTIPRQKKKIILKTTENIHLVDLQDIVSANQPIIIPSSPRGVRGGSWFPKPSRKTMNCCLIAVSSGCTSHS